MKAANERSVQSLERALDILDLLGRASSRGLSLKEICAGVQLHPSTAHHLIRTMVVRAYLQQDADTRRYCLGPRLIRLRASALHRLDLRNQAEVFARQTLKLCTKWSARNFTIRRQLSVDRKYQMLTKSKR